MQINYIEKNGKKLFSFFQHDFQKFDTGEFIDGGFDYCRSNTEVKSDTIQNLIEDIREQFTWGQNYDVNKVRLPETKYQLLKDLSSDHISGILEYFTLKLNSSVEITEQWKAIHLIFIYELQIRTRNQSV